MIIDHAASRISTVEEHRRTRLLESDVAASKPVCEIHFSNEQPVLQGRLDNISSLQDFLVAQSLTLELIQHDNMEQHELAGASMEHCGRFSYHNRDTSVGSFTSRLTRYKFEGSFDEATETWDFLNRENDREISSTSEVPVGFFDHSCSGGIDKHLDFEESDDIDSSVQLSLEGSDGEIQAAINEIRKEASQIDIVMALDQLKTAEAELEVVTRALNERSREIDDLRLQLREREERISHLELERDLHDADASQLRLDLKTCIDRMFDISAVAGTSTLVETSDRIPDIKRIQDQATISIPSIPRSIVLDGTNESDKPREEDWRQGSPSLQQNYHFAISECVFPPFQPQESVVAKAFPVLPASDSRSVFREIAMTSSPARSISVFSASSRSLFLGSSSRHCSFSEVVRNTTKDTHEGEESGQDNQRCGLFRRRQQKRSVVTGKEFAAMRSRIDELHIMMKVSLETSEKLRKRLATISRYYDGIIRKLQQQVVNIRAEKAKVKADCNSKISAVHHEKRMAITYLKNKLRDREREIEELGKKTEGTPYEI